MTELNSRAYVEGDYEKYIKELTKENMKKYFVEHFGGWNAKVSEKKFYEVINSGFVELFFLDEKFIAYVSCNTEKNDSASLLINDLHIVKEFHWKGYGKKILDFATEKAKKLNCTQMKTFVFQDNPAVKFYQAVGFNITENIEKSNSYIMIKLL